MVESPLNNWDGEERHKQCAQILAPAIWRIVEGLHLAGWRREEILIAISDAADAQLCDMTENCSTVLSEQESRERRRNP